MLCFEHTLLVRFKHICIYFEHIIWYVSNTSSGLCWTHYSLCVNHCCLLYFEDITSDVFNLVLVILLCSKHIICYDLNTLVVMFWTKQPQQQAQETTTLRCTGEKCRSKHYLLCVKHSSLLGFNHIIRHVMDTIYLLC